MRSNAWFRILAVLLVAALLPVAPLGGFGGAGVAWADGLAEVDLYLFGTYGWTPADLEFRYADDDGLIVPSRIEEAPDKYHVRYTVSFDPARCFYLHSQEYSFSIGEPVCVDSGEALVVQASRSPYMVEFRGFSMSAYFPEQGFLAGSLDFRFVHDSFDFAVALYGTGGGVYCELEQAGVTPANFYCNFAENLGSPLSIGLYAMVDNQFHLTNLLVRLDDIGLPGDVAVLDRDPAYGRVKPEVRFYGIGDETGIALYEITMLASGRTIVRYVPADGSIRYSAELPGTEVSLQPFQTVAIGLIDTEGNRFNSVVTAPLVDDFSQSGGPADYEAEGVQEIAEWLVPSDARFTDFNRDESARAGRIEWTIPEIYGDYELIAYDLYFAGEDSFASVIGGGARVYHAAGLSPFFRHLIEHVPEEAEYAAVVPLLEGSEGIRRAMPFYAHLDDLWLKLRVGVPGADEPEEVRQSVEDLLLYEHYVEWTADQVIVRAESNVGVYVDGTGPDTYVEIIVDVAGPKRSLPIRFSDPYAQMCLLTIIRLPQNLWSDISFGRLDSGEDVFDYEYRFLPKWFSTVKGALELFNPLDEVKVEVRDGNGRLLALSDPVTGGSSVTLTLGPKVQKIRLHLLSDQVRKVLGMDAAEPITIGRVATYVIGPRADLTGDGEFDQLDVRVLLYEIE